MKLYLPHNLKTFVLRAGLLLTCCCAVAQETKLPLVMVVAPDPTALEGSSSGAFTLIRSGPTDADLAVSVTLSGTASNGIDYATINNTLTIPAGSLSTDVPVSPILDTSHRGNKTVILSLQTNSNYRIDEHHWAVVKIIDDFFDLVPPSVTLIAPTNNSSFTNPPSIALVAQVTDPDAAIRSVSFYANDDFLGRATNAPFTLVWSNPPPGHFSLFARAVDQFNRSALSAPVHITVTDLRPVVSITSPTNGATFTAHSNITITADASDPDGSDTISSVTFYANHQLIGTSTTAPYAVVWSNAPAGRFALWAVAKDSSGDQGHSRPVFIKVSSPTLTSFSK